MNIVIDFESEEAIYIQLRNQIVLGIAKEELVDGEVLPSVRQLAEELGVNMHTVNKAYAMLRQEGYLSMNRRKNTYVCLTGLKEANDQGKLCEVIRLLVAEGICQGLNKEKLLRLVGDCYDKTENKNIRINEIEKE